MGTALQSLALRGLVRVGGRAVPYLPFGIVPPAAGGAVHHRAAESTTGGDRPYACPRRHRCNRDMALHDGAISQFASIVPSPALHAAAQPRARVALPGGDLEYAGAQ